MKNHCKCALRTYMSQRLNRSRNDLNLTQARFSEILMIDPRSYSDLEHGESLCCTLTFIAYLAYCCEDPLAVIRECRAILDTVRKDHLPA